MSDPVAYAVVTARDSCRHERITLVSNCVHRSGRHPERWSVVGDAERRSPRAMRGTAADECREPGAGFGVKELGSWVVRCSVARSRCWCCPWQVVDDGSPGCSRRAGAVRENACLWSGVQESLWGARHSCSGPASGWRLSCWEPLGRYANGVVEVTANAAANVATSWPASKQWSANSGSAPTRARRPNPPQASHAAKRRAYWRSVQAAAASVVPEPTVGCNRIRLSPRNYRESPPPGEWPKSTAWRSRNYSPPPGPTYSDASASASAQKPHWPAPEHRPRSWPAFHW